jgi:hypothetical protein
MLGLRVVLSQVSKSETWGTRLMEPIRDWWQAHPSDKNKDIARVGHPIVGGFEG